MSKTDITVATVGCLGNIPFKVSSKTYQTFQDMSWSSEASYSTHGRHGKKELLEFTGFKADELSFNMFLSAFLGVKPYKVLEKLNKMMKKGSIATLVIGKDIIGTKWVVTKLSRSFKHVYKDGALISCEVTVTLKEYT